MALAVVHLGVKVVAVLAFARTRFMAVPDQTFLFTRSCLDGSNLPQLPRVPTLEHLCASLTVHLVHSTAMLTH